MATSELQLFLLAYLLLASSSTIKADKYAVIVSAANNYATYSSPASICHLYHTLRDGGIPAKNIIQLNYANVTFNSNNPLPGNLVNRPAGVNLYPGCEIDYRRQDVTPEVFLNVITGNKTGVKLLTGKDGPVLETGPSDNVMLVFQDHGDPLTFYFGDTPLFAKDLLEGLKTMQKKKMYSKMFIQMESCYSGSMFEDILPDDMNIYAVASSAKDEVSIMCCYDGFRHAYVGGIFFNAFTYNVNDLDLDKTTLRDLFSIESQGVLLMQTPTEYGDTTMNALFVSDFMGNASSRKTKISKQNALTSRLINRMHVGQWEEEEEDPDIPQFLRNPPSSMVEMATLMRRLRSNRLLQPEREKLQMELDSILKAKDLSDSLIEDIVKETTGSDPIMTSRLMVEYQMVQNHECYKEVITKIFLQCPILKKKHSGFIASNPQPLINVCNGFGSRRVIEALSTAARKRKGCHTLM